jgi:hypothetical protein
VIQVTGRGQVVNDLSTLVTYSKPNEAASNADPSQLRDYCRRLGRGPAPEPTSLLPVVDAGETHIT